MWESRTVLFTFVAVSYTIQRLRQVSTISILLFFSAENLVPCAINAGPEKYSVQDQYSPQKEHTTIFSWILEENESETRNDTKAYGLQTFDAYVIILFPSAILISKLKLPRVDFMLSFDSHQILSLISLLRI